MFSLNDSAINDSQNTTGVSNQETSSGFGQILNDNTLHLKCCSYLQGSSLSFDYVHSSKYIQVSINFEQDIPSIN